jgi:hypothetical protein
MTSLPISPDFCVEESRQRSAAKRDQVLDK